MRVGKHVLKKYNIDKPVPPKFKNGGWSGIVVYEDNTNKKMAVGRTHHLARYLKNMSFSSVKKGTYGKFAQCCSFNQLNIYYMEVEDASKLRDLENDVRKAITVKKKSTSPQASFDFDKKTKNKIVKGEVVQVEECFIQAKVQPKQLDNEDGRLISVVYRDKYNRRCTLFACAGTSQAAQQLVKMINDTVKVVDANVVRLDKMTLGEFQSKHKLRMTIGERSAAAMGSRWRPELRFFASFDNCNIVENGCICGYSGDGATEEEAIRNYGKNISEKIMRINSLVNIGTDFKVPVIID